MPDESNLPGGRNPPPVEYRFQKGQSGNKRGRPPDSMSLSKAAQKIAKKKMSVTYGGIAKNQTVLEHVLDILKREAARGVPAMIDLFERIYDKLNPPIDNRPGGFLVVPETLTPREFMALMRKHNAEATRDPSVSSEPESAPDREAEAASAVAKMKRDIVLAELDKAKQGLPSPLGQAMLTYQRKWRQIYNPGDR